MGPDAHLVWEGSGSAVPLFPLWVVQQPKPALPGAKAVASTTQTLSGSGWSRDQGGFPPWTPPPRLKT